MAAMVRLSPLPAQRRQRRASFVAAAAGAGVLLAACLASSGFAAAPLGLRSALNAHKLALAASGGADETDTWRSACELEVERGVLLRDQLASLGTEVPALEEPGSEDWAASYERLRAANAALEEQLRGVRPPVGRASDEAIATPPQRFVVKMPDSGVEETVELTPFSGASAQFYTLRLRLPLGLNMTKCYEAGPKQGAFLVEDVLPGGSGEESGVIMQGDVLQAISMVVDQSDMGMKTEDFVSSVVGGLGRFRQHMYDATYIDTTDDLVEAIRSNTLFGGEAMLTLIFERDTTVSPTVAEPLVPLTD